ncbi:MAG: hypothetical protein U0Z75_09475 [Deinococcaceae bacterium]
MSELLHPDLQGKTLADIVLSPTLWAAYLNQTREGGTDALSGLQVRLSQLTGPAARARECQVFLALNKPDDAEKTLEGQDHCLCKAMYLAVRWHRATFADYTYIIEQPEILTLGRSDLELEAQMRWDFFHAQAFQQLENNSSALQYYTTCLRIARSFDVASIVHVCETQIRLLNTSSTDAKIEFLLHQLEVMKKTKDFRVHDYILQNLCILYIKNDDYISLHDCASKLPKSIVRDHLFLISDFFADNKPSSTLSYLGESRENPFCSAGYLLWKFKEYKWHTYLFKNPNHTLRHLNPVLGFELPDNLDVPILNFMMWAVKALAYIVAKDIRHAENALEQMKYISEIVEITEGLPAWLMYYTSLIETSLAYGKNEPINNKSREHVIEGLCTTESFRNFVTDLCPEIVFYLNEDKKDWVLEKVLERVLIITREGCYLNGQPVEGLPEQEALIGEIEAWYDHKRQEKKGHDYTLMSGYAKRLEELNCKGVVVTWKVVEKGSKG